MIDPDRSARRRVVLALPAAVAVLASPRGAGAASAGADIIARRPKVDAVSALGLAGGFRLDVAHGAAPSVVITGRRDLVAALSISVVQGRVDIRMPPGVDMSGREPPRVSVRTPDLARLDLNGSVAARVSGIGGPRFWLHAAGAVTVTLSGTVGRLRIVTSGSATIDARGLRAGDLRAELHGATEMSAFATRRADIALYGAGHVHVGGNPPVQNVRSYGGGAVSVD